MTNRILPVWAEVARIDAEMDERQRKIFAPPPAPKRRKLCAQTLAWIEPRPIVRQSTPLPTRPRRAAAMGLSPQQRWKLDAQRARAALDAEAV